MIHAFLKTQLREKIIFIVIIIQFDPLFYERNVSSSYLFFLNNKKRNKLFNNILLIIMVLILTNYLRITHGCSYKTCILLNVNFSINKQRRYVYVHVSTSVCIPLALIGTEIMGGGEH